MLIRLDSVDSYLGRIVEAMRPVAPQSAEIIDELRGMILVEADSFGLREGSILARARLTACELISSGRVQSLEEAGLVVVPRAWIEAEPTPDGQPGASRTGSS